MINFNRIEENIFVGTCPGNLIDVQRLKQAGITAVMNLQTKSDYVDLGIDWPRLESHYHQSNIAIYALPIIDHDDDDLTAKLPTAAATLADIVARGHRVYVHCTAGMQRSPSVVIGYLAWHRKLSLEDLREFSIEARALYDEFHNIYAKIQGEVFSYLPKEKC